MKSPKTWILIADGTQARVFEHNGPGKRLEAVRGMDFSQTPLKAQDIVTDRPGRAFSSVGSGRSGMEPQTDPVDKREADFVKEVVAELEVKLRGGAFERLIIAAAPQALGDIRQALSPAVREVVMAEMPKDLTNIPTPDLPRHFAEVLAVEG